MLAIVISTDGASKDSSNNGIFFLLVFIGLSAAINAGAFGISVLIKAAINSSQRDSIKTELLKDEYYRMEARRRLDKEGK